MFFRRPVFTARIIAASLKGKGGTAKIRSPLPYPYSAITAKEELAPLFSDLRKAVDENHQLALYFDGALLFAAPFLLIRLKRDGFSHCRAWSDKHGIHVFATA